MKKRSRITLGDLVRVGPGAPGEEWLRRYWLVVGTTTEVKNIPQAVKVLGEELVLFRDDRGRLGLLGLHCSHRGTSLEYGDIEDGGLRCPYHGWLYDVEGNCLEQPAEPKGSTFHQKVKHPSYPVRELGGLIFAYMGPDKGHPPPLSRYSPLVGQGGLRQIEATRYYDYNWFNFYENSADPSHLSILHRFSGFGEGKWGNQFFDYYNMPEFDPVETDYGMKIVMRKPGPTPDTEFVDTFSLALPSIIQIGDTEFVHLKMDEAASMKCQNEHILFLTPNDEEHFMVFTVDYYTGPDPDFFAKLAEMRATEVPQTKVGEEDRRRFMPFRGSIRQEDIMTQTTQDILGEREEHLGSSDRGVIMLRRIVREAIETVMKRRRPRGVLPRELADKMVCFDSFVGVRAKGLSESQRKHIQ